MAEQTMQSACVELGGGKVCRVALVMDADGEATELLIATGFAGDPAWQTLGRGLLSLPPDALGPLTAALSELGTP